MKLWWGLRIDQAKSPRETLNLSKIRTWSRFLLHWWALLSRKLYCTIFDRHGNQVLLVRYRPACYKRNPSLVRALKFFLYWPALLYRKLYCKNFDPGWSPSSPFTDPPIIKDTPAWLPRSSSSWTGPLGFVKNCTDQTKISDFFCLVLCGLFQW